MEVGVNIGFNIRIWIMIVLVSWFLLCILNLISKNKRQRNKIFLVWLSLNEELIKKVSDVR